MRSMSLSFWMNRVGSGWDKEFTAETAERAEKNLDGTADGRG